MKEHIYYTHVIMVVHVDVFLYRPARWFAFDSYYLGPG